MNICVEKPTIITQLENNTQTKVDELNAVVNERVLENFIMLISRTRGGGISHNKLLWAMFIYK